MSAATSDEHARWMRRALKLADAGTGSTYPNPCVGAVVVADGKLVGSGRSAVTGGAHAEVRALAKAGTRARGAALYVTLEPCDHQGRTPPCTRAIIEAGVAEVHISVIDPNVRMRGKGVARLRSAGITVYAEVLAERGAEVHRHYLHHHATGVPFVTLKAALSTDGCVATRTGDSKWITGDAHRLRAKHRGIAIGAATVVADDPSLTVRHVRGVDPIAVIFDPRLRIARERPDAALLRPGTLVLHGSDAPARAIRAIERSGAEPLRVRTLRHGGLSIPTALRRLGARDMRSLMVEGGGRLLGAFVAAAAWQQLVIYRAPVILGAGLPGFASLDPRTVRRAPRLRRLESKPLGDDVRETYEPV
jgi:diaminohydroxyphosphoribosylaminopyrimidine deaminase/5-amino-6-(5-phosphoribosylamino)uracil reductase